ncbi:PorV/PorQ family protein [candidate division TA06 bacterium]|uniref:PorV/PorQ family protein n=1 Tax=candidate division TA06 bacterium TaxID=2250710 RepID=A0A933MKU3_UNCT6|nr:PorV/PorQ family protein [candidate division TA06 bacterium]
MKKTILLLAVFSAAAAVAPAQDCGFSFLRLPLKAKAVAMGEALAGASDDPAGLPYNPAGLSLIKSRQGSAGYTNYAADIQAGSLNYVQPWDQWGTYSAGISYLNSGSIKETTMDMPTGTGNTFSYNTLALSLGYGRVISSQLFAGAALKGIYDKVQEYSAAAVAVDLGVLYEIDMEQAAKILLKAKGRHNYGSSLTAGFSALNLGVAAKAFVNEKEKLPLTFRGGLAYRPVLNRLTVALALSKAIDAGVKGQLGLEYFVKDALALRLGYNGTMGGIKTGSDLDDFTGLACGLGICIKKYRLDVAYAPMGGLGNPLRADISVEF